jgi:hypothetical protein
VILDGESVEIRKIKKQTGGYVLGKRVARFKEVVGRGSPQAADSRSGI